MSLFKWFDVIARERPGLAALILFVVMVAYSLLWRLAWKT